MSGCHIPDEEEQNVSPMIKHIQRLEERINELEAICRILAGKIL